MGLFDSELSEESNLDGCYVIKTDLTSGQADTQTVHARYKDLALVEQAFRSLKTVNLELRTVFVRIEESTRAHVFVVMLAYHIIKHLRECWRSIDATIKESLESLRELCVTDVFVRGNYAFSSIASPRKDIQELLSLCKVSIPKAIKMEKSSLFTKVKLNISRQYSNN
jgi:transposase